MVKVVMISGSRSIGDISPGLESINKIMELEFSIILGDAPGVDKLVQEYLRSQNYPNVKVYFALWSGNGNLETLLDLKRLELQAVISIETR